MSSSLDDAWAPDVVSPSSASEVSQMKQAGGYHNRRRRRERLQGLHGYLARTVVTVATSAAMLEALPESAMGSEQMGHASGAVLPDLVGGFVSLLSSALKGVGAQMKESINDLFVAIGEPPRRPFEDADAPSALLWAADIAIIFFALATVLFVLCFVTHIRGCEANKDPDAETAWSPDGKPEVTSPLTKSVRALAIIVLPALSGGMLNLKHPLVPALLCGF